MTWTGSTARTRLAKPSHDEWKPSEGQILAVNSLLTSPKVALWADPGAGKTSITLAAFTAAKQNNPALRMLVVAPLRVCQLQWRQEAAQWTQFMHHRIVFLHGPKKDELLREQADIYLINFDGLTWLEKKFPKGLPFDIVCLDESTKIKNYSAERSKALRRITARTPHKWMLTGTPNPNGYMDLFGQFLWLDGGRALGKYITHFRDMFFRKAFNGFDYDLQRGGAERIEQAIAPYVHRLPFTDLPPLVNDVRWVEFGAEGKKLYKAMDKEQVVVIGDHKIIAGSTGSHQSAREQMANGAIYKTPGSEEYVAFDDAKLDALDELIEEMNGQPLLVAFQFHHDIERIKARRGKDIAVLAGGVSAKQAEEIQRAWNAGEIKELYVHPASIGHGLNLQRGGASHVCWFSATFDLELWEQLIRRLWRQGNKASRIVNHILATKGTIDEDKLEAVVEKSIDQARLLQSMETTPDTAQKEIPMTERLGFQAGNANPAPTGWGPQTAQPTAAPVPSASWGGQPPPSAAPQAAEIQSRVQGGWHAPGAPQLAPPPAVGNVTFAPQAPVHEPMHIQTQPENRGGFTAEQVQQANQVMQFATAAPTGHVSPAPTAADVAQAEKPKRTRRTAADRLAAGEALGQTTDQVDAREAVGYDRVSLTGASDFFNVNISISGNRDACIAAIKALAGAL